MYKTDRSTYAPLIAALNRRGIAALAIDLRGHGESIEPTSAQLAERVEQRERKVFQDMKYDVQGAYAWLAERDQVDLSRVGLVGASVGCTVAFRYAMDDKSVDAIVALSPGKKYMKIRSEPDLKKIEGRDILLVSPEEEIDNANALKKAYEKAEIKIVSGQTAEGGNIHGTRMFGAVEGIESFIAGYLTDRLGTPSTKVVVSKLKGPFYMPVDHKQAVKLAPDKKRVYTSAEEAESRGLRLIGTSKKGAMGAVEL
jgi:pimeloyl-ACP methyl ester carboxylesterase